MDLTAAQINTFFTAQEQMGIPAATLPALAAEGIETPTDLTEFDAASIKQVVESLRKPGDYIPNPDGGGGTIPRPPYVLGAKSQARLTATSDLMRYYETTGRTASHANIAWDPIVKNFAQQWKALKQRDAGIEVP